MATLPKAYAPGASVDLAASAGGSVPVAASIWSDGQVVLSPKGGSVGPSEAVTMSGSWAY